jgi:hypothetical protein
LKVEEYFLRYSGVAILVIGVLLWLAGHAYNEGYWIAAQLPNDLISNSVHETMYVGFLSVRNWIGAFFYGLGFSFFLAVISIRRKRKIEHKRVASENFLQKRFEIDKSMFAFSAKMIIGSCIFFLFIVSAALWVVGAAKQGSDLFRIRVCQIRAGADLPTKINLSDGRILQGRTILRSENYTALMNPEGLHVVDLRSSPRIIESVVFPDINCAVEFPKVSQRKNTK